MKSQAPDNALEAALEIFQITACPPVIRVRTLITSLESKGRMQSHLHRRNMACAPLERSDESKPGWGPISAESEMEASEDE